MEKKLILKEWRQSKKDLKSVYEHINTMQKIIDGNQKIIEDNKFWKGIEFSERADMIAKLTKQNASANKNIIELKMLEVSIKDSLQKLSFALLGIKQND